MNMNDFDIDPNDVSVEVWRLRSLIDACVHLFPDAPSKLKHQDELLAVLGAAQELVHRLEGRLASQQMFHADFVCDPREEQSQI